MKDDKNKVPSVKLKLTKMEIDAILSAAENMEADIEDYFSFMPKSKLKKFCAAYASGVSKLRNKLDSYK